MKMISINRHFIVVVLLLLVCMPIVAQTQKTDTASTHLLNEVRKYFNSDNESAFYAACQNYREYYLAMGNLLCITKAGRTKSSMMSTTTISIVPYERRH